MLLLQIEQHGSLTRVAEHMATSQPAVTNALAELESMFDVPLFERSVRGMTPTPLGAVVLARARALVHDLGHLVQEMEAVAAGHAAHLHIGVIPFVSGRFAVGRHRPHHAARTRHHRHHPRRPRPGLAAPVARPHPGRGGGLGDSVGGPGQIDFEVLYHQPPRLIASRRLAARLGRTRLEWNMLADLDWILGTPDSPIREQVADIFLRAGLAPPTPSVQSDSSKLIGEMIVASDRAVSILPADIADELVRIAGAAIVPYSFDWTLPPISLFTRADGLRRNVDALFAAALREVFSRNGRA